MNLQMSSSWLRTAEPLVDASKRLTNKHSQLQNKLQTLLFSCFFAVSLPDPAGLDTSSGITSGNHPAQRHLTHNWPLLPPHPSASHPGWGREVGPPCPSSLSFVYEEKQEAEFLKKKSQKRSRDTRIVMAASCGSPRPRPHPSPFPPPPNQTHPAPLNPHRLDSPPIHHARCCTCCCGTSRTLRRGFCPRNTRARPLSRGGPTFTSGVHADPRIQSRCEQDAGSV